MRRIPLLLAIAGLVGACQEPTQPPNLRLEKSDAAVVRVVAPTGNPAVDIASIQAAIAAATPGAVIQFAHGTYAIGDSRETNFVVSVPGVTLQGDRRGTTLQGVQLHADDPGALTCCDLLSGAFLLNGGHQTIRRLTLDGFIMGISLGAPGSPIGGYRVEEMTFRDGYVGVILVGLSDDPTTVEGNSFENLTAPVFILGKTARIRGNLLTITDPARLTWGQPAQGMIFFPEFLSGGTVSENNVVEENTVVRYNEALVFLTAPGDMVRNNVIRRNKVINARIYNVIFVDNGTMAFLGGPGLYEDNLVQDNVLKGSEGVGLVLSSGSDNRIVGNAFHDLPGLKSTYSGYPGTAIILEAATSGNRVRGSEFENVVNTVVDLGTGNSVKGMRTAQAAIQVQRLASPAAATTTENRMGMVLFRGMLRH